MHRYVAYDIETTGLKAAFDVPLQFAAIELDDDLIETSRISLRGRPPRHVLPGPMALTVTKQRIHDVINQPMSHYEFLGRIHKHFEDCAPAVVTSFNGLKYDEEVLRHTFYGTLRNPYVTQFGGNLRLDVLHAARATAATQPGAISLPLNAKGKPSFKLEALAEANGFTEHNAHDALGDVEATAHLLSVIREKAPDVWKACSAWQSKEQVLHLLSASDPIVQLDWHAASGKPIVRVVQPMCTDNTNPNEWICVDLRCDVDELLSLSPEELRSKFRWSKGGMPLRCIKTNAMPLIASLNAAILSNVDLTYDESAVAKLRSDAAFVDRLRQAADRKKSAYTTPSHIRQHLYSGGFFPIDADRDRFAEFHAGSPHERAEMLPDFADARAGELARWLVGSEWPDTLPAGARQAFEEELREHLMSEEADWMTVPRALAEIEGLLPDAPGEERVILEEYDAHLRGLYR